MTHAATLIALAERCEQATGPDLEIDARIEAQLVGWKFDAMRESGYAVRDFEAPAYTTSLDAAMTLVPEGCSVHAFFQPRKIGHKVEIGCGHVCEKAATPALALCAAALRARAAQ
jgi:hypothetical protein